MHLSPTSKLGYLSFKKSDSSDSLSESKFDYGVDGYNYV